MGAMAQGSPLDAASLSSDEAIPFDSRRFWLWLAVVVGALTALGGVLWARYGAAIFFDMLAAMQGCF